MTLPRRQTSAISGMFSVKRSSSARSFEVLVAQDVEALGIGLHHSVLDAVMHHLDEVPGAGRTGVNVAALGAGIAFLAARRARDIAEPRSERREDRIEVIDSLLRAADHHAIAALDTPDAAGRAAIDVANALRRQFFGVADVVLVKGIAAVDDDVVPVQQAAELLDHLFGDLARRQHQPNGARLFSELLHQIGNRRRRCGAVLCQRFARLGGSRVHHAVVSRLHQAARHVAAHLAESDHADLHLFHSL